MLLFENEKASAVYFFGTEGIVREMLYSEFEALLNGVVPVTEWAGKDARAVFLEIDSKLLINAAVFFRIGFDKNGAVVNSWRLPLLELAKNAAKGPDLGAGPISLACASQCPIAYFSGDLWNPDMRAGNSHLNRLKKAVKRNRLGLVFKPLPEDDGGQRVGGQMAQLLEERLTHQLRRQYEKNFRDHMAQLLKEQRLRATTLTAEKDKAIDELKREHSQRLEQLRLELEARGRELSEAEARNSQLKDDLDGQAQKIQGLREYFEHKLEKAQGEEFEHLNALKENYALELDAKVSAATAQLKESLQMREVELLYRDEQDAQLREEINRLRREIQGILSNSGDQLLQKLSDKGVNFVTYQPGAGHITIPLSDISTFADNPLQFAARHCGVSLQQYQAWLSHYQAPVCHALNRHGQPCHANVPKVATPADFHPGETDRCADCIAATVSPVRSVR